MSKFKPYYVAIEYSMPGEPSRAASGNYVERLWLRAWSSEDAKARAVKNIESGGGVPGRVAVKGTKLYDKIFEENRIR